MRVFASLTLCPILINFGMTVTTPDLLMTGAVLLYLAHLTSGSEVGDARHRAVSGALGGVAYLAKAYALQFVVVHLAAVSLVDVLGNKAGRRRIVAATIAGYAGLLLVAAPWIACLTAKYGYLTTGSVGRFSLAWNGPGFQIPMFVQGFLPPSDPYAVSAWDDATSLSFKPWNPLASAADRAHFLSNLGRNWSGLLAIGRGFTPLAWPILAAGVASMVLVRDATIRRNGFVVLSALLLFPIGYFLLHVDQRFLSLNCVLLLVVGTWVVANIVRAVERGGLLRTVAMVARCGSFLYVPGWRQNLAASEQGLSGWSPNVVLRRALGRWSVERGRGAAKRYADLGRVVRQYVPAGATSRRRTSGTRRSF